MWGLSFVSAKRPWRKFINLKGRILAELLPLLEKSGIIPESEFFNEHSRQLRFTTNLDYLDIIRVRSFDVATFVAFGAAALGVVGKDVLMESNFEDIYAPLDLGIGKCHIAIAEPKEAALKDDISHWSHVRIATKYPYITQQYFANKGIQAECIKLNGAMELAPGLGLCSRIVDLVSTGNTLRANGLEEVEKIADISSYLIVNRTMYKTQSSRIKPLFERIKGAVSE